MPVLGNAKVEEVGSVEETFVFFVFFWSKPCFRHKEFTKKKNKKQKTKTPRDCTDNDASQMPFLRTWWESETGDERRGVYVATSLSWICSCTFQALLFLNCKMRGMNQKGRESKYLEEAGRRGSEWSWLAKVCGELGSLALSNGAEVELLTCVPGLGKFSSFSRQAANWDML